MADQPYRSRATLAVLAGGRGSRMGGPKDRLKIGGHSVLHYLMDRFDWPGSTVLVTAPDAPAMDGSTRFDGMVADPVEGEGPLRGVLTALAACSTEFVVITTVDMPGWNRAKLEWLIELFGTREKALGVMLRNAGQVEPFPLVVRRGALAAVTSMFDQGVRSVMALSDDPRFVVVEAPADWPTVTWANLNRPGDVGAFERVFIGK